MVHFTQSSCSELDLLQIPQQQDSGQSRWKKKKKFKVCQPHTRRTDKLGVNCNCVCKPKIHMVTFKCKLQTKLLGLEELYLAQSLSFTQFSKIALLESFFLHGGGGGGGGAAVPIYSYYCAQAERIEKGRRRRTQRKCHVKPPHASRPEYFISLRAASLEQ